MTESGCESGKKRRRVSAPLQWLVSLCVLFAVPARTQELTEPEVDDGASLEPAPELPELADPGVDVQAALAGIGNSWLFTRADAGLSVVDVRSGQVVYEKNGDELLAPASTMKVLTSAAALRNLGPAYRFTTDLFYTGEITPNGTLKGNLYVKGHGDPTMTTERLWKIVDDLALTGVERIEGQVFFDDSFHERGTAIVGWDKEEDIEKGTAYFATLSALSVNANTVALVVRPGAEVGANARVTLETPVERYVQFDNQVTTGAARTRRDIEVAREVLPDGTKFALTGTIPVDQEDRTWLRRTVADPTAYFMAVVEELLDERDIRVTGRLQRGATPPDAELLFTVDSPPLSQIVADMNKSSLNFVAEQVLRTLGAEVTGTGSTKAGLDVVAQYLASLGVKPPDAVLVNGSGLSRDARVKASVLTSVLVDMVRDPQVGAEFAASLAISGTDGTLWSRLREEPGRLRGKTGTLDGVHCLAGYIDAASGRRFAFAFLVNNYGTRLQAVRDVHDAFARQMFHIGTTSRE